jgi:hypothetical protein
VTGEGGSITVTATNDAASAYPAKNRGIHFDGSANGFIEIPGVQLYHTFSIHSWVLLKARKSHTLLSKDRNDFTETWSQNHFRVSINSSGMLTAELAGIRDNTAAGYKSYSASSGSVASSVWTYVTYSFEMKKGSECQVSFYTANLLRT